MGEWTEYRLGDVIELIGGGTPKTSVSEYWNGDIPWLSVADFHTGLKYVSKTEKSITEKGLNNSSTKILDKGDIIISARGTVGTIALLSKPMAFNQSCYGIRNIQGITELEYLYYLIRNTVNHLQQISHGGVFNTITRETFDAIDVLLPPLPEQKAIASVLYSLDDKIDLLHRQNKTLEAMAETLFRQWFVEEAQDNWETVKIGNYAKTNVSSINSTCDLQTIEYLDTSSLTEGRVEGYQTLTITDAPSRARRKVKHNDILISTVRPDQKHYGIIKHPKENLIVSTGFCVISCDKINPHFIYIFLTTNEMIDYLHSIADGSTSTYPSLKPVDIESIEFQLPPKEKLATFSAYANSTWNKIDYNQKQIRTLEALRDILLPKLMSGEVRVNY